MSRGDRERELLDEACGGRRPGDDLCGQARCCEGAGRDRPDRRDRAAQRFCALLDDAARRAASHCTIAAIGPVTARALASAGLPANVVAQSATAAGLVEELALAIAARHGEGT